MKPSSNARDPADEVITRKLKAPRQATRKIDGEFGRGQAAASKSREELQPSSSPATAKWPPGATPPDSNVVIDDPGALTATLAAPVPQRGPPSTEPRVPSPKAEGRGLGAGTAAREACRPSSEVRLSVARPRLSSEVADWAADATGPSSESSWLGASVRALTERGATDARDAEREAEAARRVAESARRPPDSYPPLQWLEDLGGDEQIPRSSVPTHEIRAVAIEHREAFILSLIDGVSTIREIVESCGLDELDALRIMRGLFNRGFVAVEMPASER